jgi:hypothetical protein
MARAMWRNAKPRAADSAHKIGLAMNRYRITLQHDSGRITFEQVSASWQSALRAILAIELAPVSSVLAIADMGGAA